jgi:glycosyltransferase involved in cell wall biosynthesis
MTPPGLRVAVLARAVYPLHGYGGLERHVHDLVAHLAARGVAVTLITRPPARSAAGGGLPPGTTLRIVPYRTFPFAGRRGTTVLDRSTAYPLFGFRAGRVASALAERGEIDLVHALGASGLGYARRRHRLGVPLVLNPQGLEEFGATDPARAGVKRLAYFPLRLAVRRCARAADRVIATDRALEPAVLHHLGVPRARMRTIPNAIDLERVDRLAGPDEGRRIRREAGFGEREHVLVSAGRLEENKGYQVLIQALASLQAHGGLAGEWRWVLVGDGPYRSRLTRLIADAGLSGRVLMTGRLSDADLHGWYEAATVFVHPTLYEGSSLVTLEAMAHRRAVVATMAGGLPDKVRPGVNGWLVEPGAPGALAAALSGALSDPRRLPELGAAGRTIVEREFAWPVVVEQLLAVYAELVPGKLAITTAR